MPENETAKDTDKDKDKISTEEVKVSKTVGNIRFPTGLPVITRSEQPKEPPKPRWIPRGSILNKGEIRQLCARSNPDSPLISGALNFEAQLQPNSFDVTVATVYRLVGPGIIEQDIPVTIPLYEEVAHTATQHLWLDSGVYTIKINEIVALPPDIMATVYPRSSLLRMGCDVRGGLWDAGYEGQSTMELLVHNRNGLRLQLGARVAQFVFTRLTAPLEAHETYNGRWQGERYEGTTITSGTR